MRSYLLGLLFALMLPAAGVVYLNAEIGRAEEILERPRFPAPNPRAEAILRGARQILEGLSRGERFSAAGLKRRYPALKELERGPWILSLYLPRPGQSIGLYLVELEDELPTSVASIWNLMSPRERGRLEESRLKVERLMEPRELPAGCGLRGWALNKGLDGLLLEHPKRGNHRFMPHWVIERDLARSEICQAAQESAQRAGWSGEEIQEARLRAFRSRAWLEGAGGRGVFSLLRGRLEAPEINSEILRASIRAAADYLRRETDADGRVTYEYLARQDRVRPGYNLLRHAGTIYSMLQAWRLRPDPGLLAAIKRGVRYFQLQLREDNAHPGEYFALEGRLAKLGGAGLGLCMFVEMEKAQPGSVPEAILKGLALHIQRMQKPSGAFRSFYDWDRQGIPLHQSHFYPGEAILGLIRLYQLRGERSWLQSAIKGIRYLMEERWSAAGLRLLVPPDAWLLQAIAELDRVSPDPKRRAYAFEIARLMSRHRLLDPQQTPVDLLGGGLESLDLPNVASSGSKLEALAAAARLEARHRPGARLFKDVAQATARYILSNQFGPQNSYALSRPRRAEGAFPKGPDQAVIRNDYVQHSLSGLFGLLQLLDPKAPDIALKVEARAER